MDSDGKSHREHQRWSKDARYQLWGMQFRTDGTSSLAASATGMSVSSCRREAKRLGVQLAPHPPAVRPQPYDAKLYLWEMMCTWLAIECSLDYKTVNTALTPPTKTKYDDKKFPMMRELYIKLFDFELPKRNYGHYKINDLNDGALVKYRQLYSPALMGHMLGVKTIDIGLRCRELSAALRDEHEATQAQTLLLYVWHKKGMALADICEITALPFQVVSMKLQPYDMWEHRNGKDN